MNILSNIKEGFSPILFTLLAIVSAALITIASKLGFFLFTKNDKNKSLKGIHLLGFFSIYLLTNISVPPILIRIASILSKLKIQNRLLLSSIINMVVFIIILLGFFLLFITIKKKDRYKILKDSNNTLLSDILFSFVFFIFSFPIIIFISQFLEGILIILFKVSKLPDQIAIQYLKNSMKTPSLFILAIIAIAILAPILEEFLFRGILQTYLKKYMRKYSAIVLSSLIFSFFHFSSAQGISNIVIIGTLLVLSLFLGICYEKRKSIITPIIFHSCFNILTIVTLLFKGD